MTSLYLFLTGPGLWFTFIFFGAGILMRLMILFKISLKKDRILYNHINWLWGFKSLVRWLIPFGSDAMRRQPVFTVAIFVFHFLLVGIPLFLNAHNTLWDESFGKCLPSMSDGWADSLTVLFIVTGLFLLLRRCFRKEVRMIASSWDYILLSLTMLPFLTGFLAYHQWSPYGLMMILHILSAEILLILIPVTKLSHMVLFFFTRVYIGFEMGGRRGARSW